MGQESFKSALIPVVPTRWILPGLDAKPPEPLMLVPYWGEYSTSVFALLEGQKVELDLIDSLPVFKMKQSIWDE